MSVELALAGHRALAANVEGRKRIHLACIGDAHDHAKLLIHLRVGRGRLHAPKFERRPCISVEVWEDRRSFDRLRGEPQRCLRADRAGRCRGWRAVFGQQRTGDAIEGARALNIALDNSDAGYAPCTDRLMQVVDGCLFQTEWKLFGVGPRPQRCIALHSFALVDTWHGGVTQARIP
jgi:hypothetical protein